jgi:hypothetical protein
MLVLVQACDGSEEPPGIDAGATGDAALDAAEPASDANGSVDAQAPVDAARDAFVRPVCNAVAPTSCPDPAPRYADVAPIFEQRCVSCHSPLWTGPWPLDTYKHVSDWQDTIRSNLLDCTMPPPDSDAGPLLDEESAKILAFIRCGLPM